MTVTQNGPEAHEQSQEIEVCFVLKGRRWEFQGEWIVTGTDFSFKKSIFTAKRVWILVGASR